MKMKRMMAAMTAAALSLTMLTGCGGASQSDTKADDTRSGESVELTVFAPEIILCPVYIDMIIHIRVLHAKYL